jgi:hypothetical protein
MTARRELSALWRSAQGAREQLEQHDAGGAAPAERPLRALEAELATAIQRLESAGMLTDVHRARLDEAASTLGMAAAGTLSPEAALETYTGAIEAVALAYRIFLAAPLPRGIGSSSAGRRRVMSTAPP